MWLGAQMCDDFYRLKHIWQGSSSSSSSRHQRWWMMLGPVEREADDTSGPLGILYAINITSRHSMCQFCMAGTQKQTASLQAFSSLWHSQNWTSPEQHKDVTARMLSADSTVYCTNKTLKKLEDDYLGTSPPVLSLYFTSSAGPLQNCSFVA